MARFLIGTIPVLGHVSPAVPIARRLVERGHEVWWYSGEEFQTKIEQTGAKYVPMVQAHSHVSQLSADWMARRNALQGLARLKFDLKHFFVDEAIAHVQDYQVLLQQFPADVLLSDSFFLGAGWMHELGGPPWAQIGISILTLTSQDTAPTGLGLPPATTRLDRWRNRGLNYGVPSLLFRDVLAYINQARAQLGLGKTNHHFFDTLSPFLYLAGTIPQFEYPRRDLPPQVHFVGPLLYSGEPPDVSRASAPSSSSPLSSSPLTPSPVNPSPPSNSPPSVSEFTPPDWWEELYKTQKPVVLVTQGTIATQMSQLIIPALQALGQEDLLVVVTTGGQVLDPEVPIPANARIATFIPYEVLLPQVDVMVTNGGYNGVQLALMHGVPLVVAGQTEDKIEVCARVAWAGVGLNLQTQTPSPSQIQAAVRRVLAEPQYRAQAQQFQRLMAESQPAARSVALLEQLATTREPVLDLR